MLILINVIFGLLTIYWGHAWLEYSLAVAPIMIIVSTLGWILSGLFLFYLSED